MRRPDAELLAPVLSWDDFHARFHREWKQGEHVSLIGPTQQGKTTFGLQLLGRRSHTVVIGTKPKDKTLDQLVKGPDRYRRIESWSERMVTDRRLLLWPRWRNPRDTGPQAAAIGVALGEIFGAGGWCVFADEVSYLVRMLRLDRELLGFWQQGASIGLTLMAATQRPAHVPLDLYSAASHLFFWRTNDETDLRRVSGMNGVASQTVRSIVATLDRHQALYVNTRDGRMSRVTAPAPTK